MDRDTKTDQLRKAGWRIFNNSNCATKLCTNKKVQTITHFYSYGVSGVKNKENILNLKVYISISIYTPHLRYIIGPVWLLLRRMFPQQLNVY